jgi:hypothetical protein
MYRIATLLLLRSERTVRYARLYRYDNELLLVLSPGGDSTRVYAMLDSTQLSSISSCS